MNRRSLLIGSALCAIARGGASAQSDLKSTPTTVPVSVRGRYYWELVFDYDNTGNAGEIKQETTIRKKRTVDVKQFLADKFNVTSGYKLDQEVGATLHYGGLEGNSKTNYSLHSETASELEKRTESGTVDESDEQTTRSYTISGNSKLTLYRLCYEMDGVLVKTDTFATKPSDDAFVNLKFTLTKHLLGLNSMIEQFSKTYPERVNKDEWKAIRNSIVSNAAQPEDVRFYNFVQNLSTITPSSENKDEWKAIRDTCFEIIRDWNVTEHQALLIKLLARFRDTNPGENKDEWKAIRTVADDVNSKLKQIF